MSAEPIARVVSDLLQRRVKPIDGAMNVGVKLQGPDKKLFDLLLGLVMDPIVIDATALYAELSESRHSVNIYEDHPCIAPPYEEFITAYVNQHGNVTVMHSSVSSVDPLKPPWEALADTHDIDWEQVKWRLDTVVWVGGRGAQGSMPTHGPRHLWQFAIGPQGEPLDLHWVSLVRDYPVKNWDMAHLVLLATLRFLNCSNVELAEPRRERHEAKRIARTGVTVKTLNVYPAGKSSKSKGGESLGVPLHSVRGHFASFGPEYGKGLLFGKLSGRYWISAHARGSKELGEVKKDYRVVAK